MAKNQESETDLNCSICGSAGVNRVYLGQVYCETHYFMAKMHAKMLSQSKESPPGTVYRATTNPTKGMLNNRNTKLHGDTIGPKIGGRKGHRWQLMA